MVQLQLHDPEAAVRVLGWEVVAHTGFEVFELSALVVRLFNDLRLREKRCCARDVPVGCVIDKDDEMELALISDFVQFGARLSTSAALALLRRKPESEAERKRLAAVHPAPTLSRSGRLRDPSDGDDWKTERFVTSRFDVPRRRSKEFAQNTARLCGIFASRK